MQTKTHSDPMSLSEIVETYPQAKTTVRRLMKENQAFLDEANEHRNNIRGHLAGKVVMMDIDFVAGLVMTVQYGNEIEQQEEHLARNKRLLYLYVPPDQGEVNGVSEAQIAQAKTVPIRQLIKVNSANKAKCLWHNDKNPSMHVYKNNTLYCFVCQKWGSSVDVCMYINNISFIPAVRMLLKI